MSFNMNVNKSAKSPGTAASYIAICRINTSRSQFQNNARAAAERLEHVMLINDLHSIRSVCNNVEGYEQRPKLCLIKRLRHAP